MLFSEQLSYNIGRKDLLLAFLFVLTACFAMTEVSVPINRKSGSNASLEETAAPLPTEGRDQQKYKHKGRLGRPRIHPENGNETSNSSDNNRASFSNGTSGGLVRSVNEVIPKVWIISNFSAPTMAKIASEVLKKGDKVVLGLCPGGDNEAQLLKKADRLRHWCPDRCIVVELDVR